MNSEKDKILMKIVMSADHVLNIYLYVIQNFNFIINLNLILTFTSCISNLGGFVWHDLNMEPIVNSGNLPELGNFRNIIE